MSFNGVDWPQLTKQAIEVSLFGKENPHGLMRHMAELAKKVFQNEGVGVVTSNLSAVSSRIGGRGGAVSL
jgi:hypothetical protein